MDFKNNEFTLLSEEQTFGSRKIDVIKKIGRMCAISDFAILLGSYVSSGCFVEDDSSLSRRTIWWWTKSYDGDGNVRGFNERGFLSRYKAGSRSCSVRPVLQLSNIADISPNGVKGSSGVLEVEYGEYPQYAVDARLGKILDNELSVGRLKKTGKTYTTDSVDPDDNDTSFKPRKHEEFEYNGRKYIRIVGNNNGYELLDRRIVVFGEPYWVEVSPITWLVDEKSGLMLSKTCLVSGIRFCNDGEYNGDFKTTEMYMFLNKYFAKDIGHSVINEMTLEDKKIESLGLNDFVLQSIDNLVVNQINNLEPEDQIKYLREAQNLLNDYTNRNVKLINHDSSKINIDIENYDKIRLDTLKGILDIKERIKEENQKDSQLRELTKESKLLNDRIEELSQLNTEQNNSFSKVKVKTLKENNKNIV